MCLIVFAYKAHPKYKFIFAANRDEFYDRPTEQAGYWKDHPELLAGKDLLANGTWMGITKRGRFAAVTNYRDLRNIKENSPSRGLLTRDFLLGNQTAEEFYNSIKDRLSNYNGFNLILGNTDNIYYFSTHRNDLTKLEPGIYGLSNAIIDTPWPKVLRSKERLRKLLQQTEFHHDDVLNLLGEMETASDTDLPDTGVGLELEKVLSSVFIRSPKYGTRASTAVIVDNNNTVNFVEKNFYGNQQTFSYKEYSFIIKELVKD